jgi:hypothetical protein
MTREGALEALGRRLFDWFSEIDRERKAKEIEWAENLRQYRGEYDPQELQRIKSRGGSEIYPKLTRYKVLTALAKIHSIVFPDIDKNWGIKPTPYPTIPHDALVKIIQDLIVVDEQGQPIRPTDDAIYAAIREYVTERARKMETVLEDNLLNMDYVSLCTKVLFSGILFGTGVLKGVLTKSKTNVRWVLNPQGGYTAKKEKEYVPYAEFVPIWDFYPDMSVSNIEDCDGIFQRHILSKHDLRLLKRREDFNAEAIEKVLRKYKDGKADIKTWETEIYSNYQAAARRNKFEVIEFWGYVDGNTFRDCGVEIPDEALNAEVEANIWMAGDTIIKATLNPFESETRPYHVFYYEKDETSIFGTGLPRVCRDSQIALSAASRMILDNAAIVCGPILEVNHELLLQNGQDITNIHPRKIFLREGKGAEAQYPAVRSYTFDSHLGELIKIIDLFKTLMDEETTIYSFFNDRPDRDAKESATGISMRMATLNMTIKEIVRRFDHMITSFIRALYQWNMQFNPREDIKGDFDIIAIGSSVMISKEAMMESLVEFSKTIRADEVPYIKTYEFLRERMKAHNLPYYDLLRSEEEVMALMQESTDPDKLALEKDAMKADIDYTRSKALHMLAKSKRQEFDITSRKPWEDLVVDAEVKKAQAHALKLLMDAKKKESSEL